ncbi:MAG: hypothetical protein QM811_23405 [Pirellulales bacterium]
MSFPTLSVLFDHPRAGIANMAIDEALLDAAGEGALGPLLRFYEWSPATLSLGYFQGSSERAGHAASRNCDIVRRASGGGAILHDRELTYSLVLPAEHPLATKAEPLYRAVHQALIETLSDEWTIDARFWDQVAPRSAGAPNDVSFACGDVADILPHNATSKHAAATRPASRKTSEPFLCFQRRSPGDLVLADARGRAGRVDPVDLSVAAATSPTESVDIRVVENPRERPASSTGGRVAARQRLAGDIGFCAGVTGDRGTDRHELRRRNPGRTLAAWAGPAARIHGLHDSGIGRCRAARTI